MREILFRGKQGKTSEWGYSEHPYGTMSRGELMISFVEDTIGQFTGKFDRNNIKIFDGDIVEVIDYEDKSVVGIVVWDDSEAGFLLTFDGWLIGLGGLYSSNLKVIGNIHDNPELVGDSNAE